MTATKSATSVASAAPITSKTAVSTSASPSSSNTKNPALAGSNNPQVISRADSSKSIQPGNAGGPTDSGNYVGTSPTNQ